MTCKCSNLGIRETFKFCPYCGKKFLGDQINRYRYEGQMISGSRGSYAIKTKEFRAPLKGEYFLSGAVPIAYKSYNDLTEKYWIAKIIKPS